MLSTRKDVRILLYQKYYVAFIDILGFKKYVNKNPFEKIYTTLSLIETEAVASRHGIKWMYGIDIQDIKILCISDSIIIGIEKDIPHAFDAIIWLCATFQLEVLLNSRLLVRGGISCGDFYMDKSKKTGTPILFGPAYNKAVELEKSEKAGKLPLIIIDENIDIGADVLTNQPFLAKDCKNRQIFINYMYRAKEVGAFDMKMRFVAREIVNQIKISESDDDVKRKYAWTRDYIVQVLGDETVFSMENIKLCERNQQEVNICVEFAGQEDTNHGQP